MRYLTHGTSPESLLSILQGGLNERFSGGLFGQGTYLAEELLADFVRFFSGQRWFPWKS